ncbi:MAG: FtsW/RodA/SpoVE family cell cycle protein, partial [Actinomycetota bacterium]|nr:FtsW/RodA/SpoVE family cell cycle protein [Actinomycetota bacterium]
IFIIVHLALRRMVPMADNLLFPICAGLTFIGLVMIYRVNPELCREQTLWILVASLAMLVVVLFLRNYEVLANYKYTLALVGLLLLGSTMIVGKEVHGAKLWLKLGPLSFQPSEISKLLIAIFLAAYFAEKHEVLSVSTHRVLGITVPELKYFIPLLAMWGLSVLMMVFQKDLGSSLLFFGIFISMLYVATGKKSYVLTGAVLFILGAVFCYFSFAHVRVRFETWLQPLNPQTIAGTSYQVSQSLFAFASGGLSGTGLGLGYPKLIPAVETDFIFSAIGEELGLIGACSIVILYMLFISRGMKLALDYKDDFGKLLCAGLVSIIGIQSFIIMGGVTGLVPLTGVTLPFVSYGGSSLLANFILLGLLLILSHREASSRLRHIRKVERR